VLEEGGNEDSIVGREDNLMDLAIDEDEQQKAKHIYYERSQDVKEPNSNLSRIDIGKAGSALPSAFDDSEVRQCQGTQQQPGVWQSSTSETASRPALITAELKVASGNL
jgi:hypothetical protein